MRGAVLIVSHGTDDHVPLVRAELDELGIEVIWFDTDAYGSESNASFQIENCSPAVVFRVGKLEHRGDVVRAVFFRHIRLPRAPHVADLAARQMAESELRSTLEGALLALEPALWMNYPYANRFSRSKLMQLRLATRLGFKVPETCITADPRIVRERYRRWNGEMVAKLAGGQIVGDTTESQYVILTTLITPEDLKDDDSLSACPAIYQRRVQKEYELRVTVVGEDVFACRIDSQALEISQVDWRAAGPSALHQKPYKLDEAIASQCRALLRYLGLEIAGLDFLVTPEGETVFLEINAAGAWAWVEQATGLPIAAAIARRLALGAQPEAPFTVRVP